jgi:hypothetical protein
MKENIEIGPICARAGALKGVSAPKKTRAGAQIAARGR